MRRLKTLIAGLAAAAVLTACSTVGNTACRAVTI